jgi:hypothetical protein
MSNNNTSPGGIFGDILDSTVEARRINSKAVLFQLGIMSAFAVATLFLFEILRPSNKVRSLKHPGIAIF